ncbi:MAG: 2-oxoacid:acceptor oxidoreductase family protein [Elusimicrobia bacterium]|nr:2-oxoacid:acceptor oxidoreductase family protein [Elusimicrobiota bacterium]
MLEEIIISGAGGQGIMFLGTLLCNVAVSQGKYTTFFPSYGAEIRGGTANCSVVISDDEIGSPVISNPSILIAMNEPSYRRFEPKVRKDGLVFVNSSLMQSIPEGKICVPATEIALQTGDIRTTNMVILGKFVSVTRIFRADLVEDVAKNMLSSKKKLLNANLAAFKRGLEL